VPEYALRTPCWANALQNKKIDPKKHTFFRKPRKKKTKTQEAYKPS